MGFEGGELRFEVFDVALFAFAEGALAGRGKGRNRLTLEEL